MKKLLLLLSLFLLIGCTNQYQKENEELKTQVQELQKKFEQQSATTTPQQPKAQQPKPTQPKSSPRLPPQEKPKEIDGVSKTTNCFAFADEKMRGERTRLRNTISIEINAARTEAQKIWEETRIIDHDQSIQFAVDEVNQKYEEYFDSFQKKKFAECLYIQNDLL